MYEVVFVYSRFDVLGTFSDRENAERCAAAIRLAFELAGVDEEAICSVQVEKVQKTEGTEKNMFAQEMKKLVVAFHETEAKEDFKEAKEGIFEIARRGGSFKRMSVHNERIECLRQLFQQEGFVVEVKENPYTDNDEYSEMCVRW